METERGKKKRISLRVVCQDGTEVHFKAKQTTPMRKLIEAFCARQGQSVASMRFLYDGRRLDADATPASMDMEEDDIIDAILEQTGGFRNLGNLGNFAGMVL
jgi:small ubiquitin-related modifier